MVFISVCVGVLGRCTPGYCQNGGVCEEKISGASIYAYCQCPAGLSGQCCQTCKWQKQDFRKAENCFFFLLAYFSCPAPGIYADPRNCKFGRYFQCTGLTLTSASCPRGLRYNFMKMQCDSGVSCPA